VFPPALAKREVTLEQTAPGRYTASFDVPQSGRYLLDLGLSRDGVPLAPQSRGLVVGYPDELRLRPTDEDLLRELSRLTGGTFRPSPEAVFAPPEQVAREVVPLWPHLVTLAALLLVADVALRRLRQAG
jgi:Ca-activated chloride channel homolog